MLILGYVISFGIADIKLASPDYYKIFWLALLSTALFAFPYEITYKQGRRDNLPNYVIYRSIFLLYFCPFLAGIAIYYFG